MMNIRTNIKLLLFLVITPFLAIENTFAQESTISLQVGVPVSSEIVSRKPEQFSVLLSANQTARVRVKQTGMDVSLVAINGAGTEILKWGLPLGRVGNEEILVVAAETGGYRIDVIPGNRHSRGGKFVIELLEVRKTVEEDLIKNQAARTITLLMDKAVQLRAKETASSYKEALEAWKKVAEFAKIKQDELAEARAIYAMGNLYLDLGEIQKALDVNLQALAAWRKFGVKRYELIAAGRIGNMWTAIGEYDKAIAQYEECRRINLTVKSRTNEASLLRNIGNAYLLNGQPQTALPFFEKSLAIYVELGARTWEASVLNDLGRTHLAFGDYTKGIEYLKKALSLHERFGHKLNTARYNFSLGKAYKEVGENEKAFDYIQKANLAAKSIGNVNYIAHSYYLLAKIEYEKHNLTKAISNLESGLVGIEKRRREIRSKSSRASYFSTVQNFYELYTELLIERSKENENEEDVALAFYASERSRSRSLVDLLEEAKVDIDGGTDVEFLQRRKNLVDELAARYRKKERLLSRKTRVDKLDKINAEISNLEIDLENLILQIQTKNPKYSDLIRGKTVSVNDMQELLEDETILLEYKLGEKRSHLWLVTNSSITHFELPKREDVQKKVREFYDLTLAKSNNNLSVELGEMLLKQVRNEIKGKRLAIVADGILQYLPFSALQDSDASYLADKHEVVMLPSASVLAQIREKSSISTNRSIAVFADPVFDKQDSRIKSNNEAETLTVEMQKVTRDFRFGETLPRLLASRREARSISKFADKKQSSFMTDFEASVENIEKANLKDYGVLHFATHGLLNTTNPELSGLVFSLFDKEGQPQDGFLSLNDIYNLSLSSEMVVLSACQTALGKDVRGEGLIGMSRGFLYAGSKRIVASLWKVDDAATAEFMKRFYKNHLQKGLPASKALQQTKIEMKKVKRYQSPYYWGAFTLLGDWK